MAKIGSSQKPASPLGGRRIGGAAPASDGAPGPDVPPAGQQPAAGTTLPQRLEYATLAGELTAVPVTYADGPDWETILSDDVFARLYLAAPLHPQITDAQVAANKAVLAGFWQLKLNSFITGNRDIEVTYRSGTVTKALDQLAAAAEALADAAGRAACFAQLDGRRRTEAGQKMDVYLRPLLQSPVLNNKVFQLAIAEGEAFGFKVAEAEAHLLQSLRQAGYAPVKTINQSPNLLLAEWTPGGVPLTNRPSTKVMGHDVYSLAEAGQVLYAAFTSSTERDKAARNLESADYLENIAKDLKENDVQLDLREVLRDKSLDQAQRRLKALYLLGPGLPFSLDGVVAEITSPAQLLRRVAVSAKDFGVAEAAFTAGLLPIWLRAAGTADIKTALPAAGKPKALDFRYFLHKAAPSLPLWIGEESFTSPAQLAAYIRRDENTWKMVYGSLNAGNLIPWLRALGRTDILEQQEQLAAAFISPDASLDNARPRLAVQALLEALDPQTAVPTLDADLSVVDLTGLSGETKVQRTLTFTNETGGAVWVFLALEPPLEGVHFFPREVFFDQRAPGQKLPVLVTGDPALMPRDGQHTAQLTVRTAYVAGSVPVQASAVFPQKQFLQFVIGAALAMAAILGGVRWLLGLMLTQSSYEDMLNQRELLPLSRAVEAGYGPALLVTLLLLAGLLYAFWRVLRKLANPHPAL